MRAAIPLLFTLASVTACSGSVTGTGGPDPSTGNNDNGSGFQSPENCTDGICESGGTTSGSSGSKLPAKGEGDPNAQPSEWDAMFDAPANSSTTDGLVSGLWAGSTYYADVRIKLEVSKITIAVKCGSQPAKGLEVGAQVGNSTIKILASKLAGTEYDTCGIKVTPLVIPKCSSTKTIECFQIDGTTLSFVGVWLFSSGGSGPEEDFTKLSD